MVADRWAVLIQCRLSYSSANTKLDGGSEMMDRGIMEVGENVRSGADRIPKAVSPATVGSNTLVRLDDTVANLHRMTSTVSGRFGAVCVQSDRVEEEVALCGYGDQPPYFGHINRAIDEIQRCLHALEDLVNRCELPD